MRFLSIDCHIGIRDLQSIFEKLGHVLDVWSISDHAKLMNWERAKVDVVNEKTWWNLDQSMCDRFYERYKNEFKKYDGFVTYYPPAFAMLYEKFEKPIIVHVPLRYDIPFFGNPKKWEWLVSGLQRGIDSGQIIPSVTNRVDLQYLKNTVNRDFQRIPSLCDYTGVKYIGDKEEYLFCSKFKALRDWLPNIPFNAPTAGHSWEELTRYKAAIYVPYTNTMVALFEQYTANIPLLFPTSVFLVQLWKEFFNQGVMIELSHRKIFKCSPGTPVSFQGIDLNEYNSEESFAYWSALSDFYDEEWMPYIQHYDSIYDLEDQLNTLDFLEISDNMERFSEKKKLMICDKWHRVLNKIQR